MRLVTSDALARIEVAVRALIVSCHTAAFPDNPFAYNEHSSLPGLKLRRHTELLNTIARAMGIAKDEPDIAKLEAEEQAAVAKLKKFSRGKVVQAKRDAKRRVESNSKSRRGGTVKTGGKSSVVAGDGKTLYRVNGIRGIEFGSHGTGRRVSGMSPKLAKKV